MRTALSPDNPGGYSRAGYAWERVPAAGSAHLDYGCFEGSFLASLASKGPRRRVGIDVSRDAIQRGLQKHPELELIHHQETQRLPFPDGAFDSISMMDVLEHVADQQGVLDELYRVLTPDGLLIVTVPGLYLFSFLDLGNMKFRFPRLHRFCYCCIHSRQAYEQRYAANPDGLIGDVSAQKAWHEHFSRDTLAALLGKSGFEVTDWDGTAFFNRVLSLVGTPMAQVAPLRRLLAPLYNADARAFASANLFCTARKRP